MSTPSQPLSDTTVRRSRFGIQRLRWLLLAVLAIALLGFTAGVMLLVQQIFNNFGPAVRQDLEWQAARGAEQLAQNADLGLAVDDREMVTQAFGDFRYFEDVIAVVAVNSAGKVVAEHGRAPEPVVALFAGPQRVVRSTPGYIVAWAAAVIEGSAVGKVALVISTRRLVESRAWLRRISIGTTAAAALALLCGILFVNFFTGTIAARDAQLAGYASDLEKKIVERTSELDGRNREMRVVFDNVEQGLVAVSLRDGVMGSERSTIVDRWFGVPAPDVRFEDYIRASDKAAADWFSMGLQALVEEVLPEDLLLDQLPKRMARGERTLRLTYTPIAAAGEKSGRQLLVVMTDVTDELARERMERDTQEMMQIFQRATVDRVGIQQFFAEAGHLVRQATEEGGGIERDLHVIHTLKGNCRQLGLDSMGDLCHEAETEMQDDRQPLGGDTRQRIAARWQRLIALAPFAWAERPPHIEIDEDDLRQMLEGLRARAPYRDLVRLAASWQLEPVALRFKRLAEKARYTCERLGKPPVTIHGDAGGLRLDSGQWAPFWAALVHAINNAIDHGIEDPHTRIARGKPSAGTLWLTAGQEERAGKIEVTVSVRDDGGGLDWQRLAAQATARNLPHATREDLVEAMYVEGVSTRERVGYCSGRGIGLAALRQTTRALGGHMEIQSEDGVGTTLWFRFPSSAELTVAA